MAEFELLAQCQSAPLLAGRDAHRLWPCRLRRLGGLLPSPDERPPVPFFARCGPWRFPARRRSAPTRIPTSGRRCHHVRRKDRPHGRAPPWCRSPSGACLAPTLRRQIRGPHRRSAAVLFSLLRASSVHRVSSRLATMSHREQPNSPVHHRWQLPGCRPHDIRHGGRRGGGHVLGHVLDHVLGHGAALRGCTCRSWGSRSHHDRRRRTARSGGSMQ